MNPLAYHASLHHWQFFVTLTYGHDRVGGKVPVQGERRKMLFSWLRKVHLGQYSTREGDYMHRTRWHDLLWLAREERGELGGRYHFHVLLAGLPAARHNVTEANVLIDLWSKCGGGIADCRMYDARLDGVSYVLKGLEQWSFEGANSYEVAKFDGLGDCMPILADSCVKAWSNTLRKWASRAKEPEASSGTGTADFSGRSLSARRKARKRKLRAKETQAELEKRIRASWLGFHPAGASFVR